MKMDKNGEPLWSKTIEAVEPIRYYYPQSIKMTEDEGVVVAGNIGYGSGFSYGGGIFIFRLNSQGEFGDILDSTSQPLFPTADIDIYPNPTVNKITIQNTGDVLESYQVSLYDMQATKLQTATLQGTALELYLNDLPSGSYILELRNDRNQAYQKLIVKQ